MLSANEGAAVMLLAFAVIAFGGAMLGDTSRFALEAGYAAMMIAEGVGVVAVLGGRGRLALLCAGAGLLLAPILFLSHVSCCLD